MNNSQEVIHHATRAAEAHSTTVHRALTLYVAAQCGTPLEADHAERALRIALEAQAAGHEPVAANGSTYKARCEAAKAALTVWRGATPFMTLDAVTKTFHGTANDTRFHEGWRAHGDSWARDYLRGCAERGVDRVGHPEDIRAANLELGIK